MGSNVENIVEDNYRYVHNQD